MMQPSVEGTCLLVTVEDRSYIDKETKERKEFKTCHVDIFDETAGVASVRLAEAAAAKAVAMKGKRVALLLTSFGIEDGTPRYRASDIREVATGRGK